MQDYCARNINYLRVSLTGCCNLRCLYCMPKQGCSMPKESLNKNEFIKLISLIVETGIKKLRFTGGEPLIYPELGDLIAHFKRQGSIEKIALTTNGILLQQKLAELVDCGLDEINLSLDTVDSELFKRLTRGGDIQNVFSGIKAAKMKNLPLKLNSVILQNINDEEKFLFPLIEFAQQHKLVLRFIELMPINVASHYNGVKEDRLKAVIAKKYGFFSLLKSGDGPAHYYTVGDLPMKIGFISALSHEFCNQCNRIRLTSTGFLKPCLHQRRGIDLKQLLDISSSDEVLRKAIAECIYHKPPRHYLEDRSFKDKELMSMVQIGG